MKKIFLLLMSVVLLNSCYSLIVKPMIRTTAAVIGAPFYIAGKLMPKTDNAQYRQGYHAYMVEEYKEKINALMNDILKREWEETTFYKEKILLPKGLTVKNGILLDVETDYGLPVRFIGASYPCYFDGKKGVYDLKSKEEYYLKGDAKNYYKIESETEKGKLLEKLILEKNNVQRGCQ